MLTMGAVEPPTDPRTLAGQLVVGGFAGTDPGDGAFREYLRAMREGRRGGAVLFRRNVAGEGDGLPLQVAHLNDALAKATPAGFPPLLAVDQEGGRVARLGAPFLAVPPLALLGQVPGDEGIVFARRVAQAQGAELAAVGFSMNFAPILDVDTAPPGAPPSRIIGDRAFGRDARRVATLGVAYAEGLEAGGVLPCGKHFPGHGGTTVDSHLALPELPFGRERLATLDLVPFDEAARAKIAALMSAHVVVRALDASRPATLSPALATDLLRGEMGFDGVLFSDDLEMKAITLPVEDAAVGAIAAGCDVLLLCKEMDLQERALAGLIREMERSPAFRRRCAEAFTRFVSLRRRRPPSPRLDPAFLEKQIGGPASREVADELAALRGGRGLRAPQRPHLAPPKKAPSRRKR